MTSHDDPQTAQASDKPLREAVDRFMRHQVTGTREAMDALTQLVDAAHAFYAYPQVGQWQPIETAPRDGTAMLVMRDIWPGTKSGRAEECNGHNTYVAAWWASEDDDSKGRWVCYMDAVFDPTCPIRPTHWMPLPAPPAPSQSEPQAASRINPEAT
jgi:hypothetical protein